MSNNNAINDVSRIAFKYWELVHKQARSQYLAGKRSASMHNWLGIPVVVTATLVGTAIFSTLSENPTFWLKIGTGLVSLLAAVLSALQTFFGFSEQAARHRAAAADYRGVRRRLEVFLVKYKQEADQDRNAAINELQAIADEITTLEQRSPDVADCFYERAKKEFKSDKEPFFTSTEFQKQVDAVPRPLGMISVFISLWSLLVAQVPVTAIAQDDIGMGETYIEKTSNRYSEYQIVTTIINNGTRLASSFDAACQYTCPPGDPTPWTKFDIVQSGYIPKDGRATYKVQFHYMCVVRPRVVNFHCTILQADGYEREYSVNLVLP